MSATASASGRGRLGGGWVRARVESLRLPGSSVIEMPGRRALSRFRSRKLLDAPPSSPPSSPLGVSFRFREPLGTSWLGPGKQVAARSRDLVEMRNLSRRELAQEHVLEAHIESPS